MSDSVLIYAKQRLSYGKFKRFKEYYRKQGLFQANHAITVVLDPAKALTMQRELLDAWDAVDVSDETSSPHDEAILEYLISTEDRNIRSPEKLREVKEWRALFNKVRPSTKTNKDSYAEVYRLLKDQSSLNAEVPNTETIRKCIKALNEAEKAVK